MTKQPTALVTGGSAGIGRSICEHLLERAYTVINLSRRASDSTHQRLIDVQVDLADVDATCAAIAELSGQHEITNLVHNAGVIKPALLEDVDLRDVADLGIHVEVVALVEIELL